MLFPLSWCCYCEKPKLDSLKYLNISLVKESGREGTEHILFQKVGLLVAIPCAYAQATGSASKGTWVDSVSSASTRWYGLRRLWNGIFLVQDLISPWIINYTFMLILKSVIRLLDRSEVFTCPAYFHSFVDNMNIASTLDAGIKTGMYRAQQRCSLWIYTMESRVCISCLSPQGFWVVYIIKTRVKREDSK